MRFLGWKAQGLCHGEVEKEGALRVTGRTAEALLSAAHVFRGVLTEWAERARGTLLLTMHRVHHSSTQPLTGQQKPNLLEAMGVLLYTFECSHLVFKLYRDKLNLCGLLKITRF